MNFENLDDVFLVINPNSGKKNIRKLLLFIKKNVPELNFVVCQNKNDADDIFQKYIHKYKYFILAGGDGTINQALPFFVGKKDKLLSVLPIGSGNGFAKEMGFKNNLMMLLQDILRGETMEVDLLKINNHFSINVAGIGLEGYIASLFYGQKNRGLFKYIVLTMKGIFSFQPFFGKLSQVDFNQESSYISFSIANNRQFGNNAFIAPQAKPNDGFMEVVMVKPFPFYLYPLFFYKLFRGTLKSSEYLTYKTTNQELVISTDCQFAHVDGEPIECNGALHISMFPNAISIVKTKFSNHT